jgi:hypothetical protein
MCVMNPLIPLIISIPFIAFWIWMFWDFTQNPYIPSNARVYWLIGFVFPNILTAGYYYFNQYSRDE